MEKNATTIATFDDWVDYFKKWQDDIGLDRKVFGDYEWCTKFGEIDSGEVEFGDFAGRAKWESVMQIPDQRIRDSLLHLIVYQGDTEFASTEQQRHLLANAPSEYELQAAARVMREEMRHGWQIVEIVQKYINRWFSSALDLFGIDHSSSASWFYVWGLKGRFDEHGPCGDRPEVHQPLVLLCAGPVRHRFVVRVKEGRFDEHERGIDKDHLNDRARTQYHREVTDLIGLLNNDITEGRTRLYTPDIKFNRSLGEYQGKTYSVRGELLSSEDFVSHLADVLPGPADRARLEEIFKEKGWIYPVGEQVTV